MGTGKFGGRMGGDAVLCQTTLTTYVCYGQTWMERSVRMDQHATWYGGRLWPSHTALHWDLDPPKGAQQPPHISAHVYSCQTAKLGAVPLWGEELGPHLTQCRLRRSLAAYQMAS